MIFTFNFKFSSVVYMAFLSRHQNGLDPTKRFSFIILTFLFGKTGL